MSPASKTPVWLLTGTTSGFGLALAHEALSRGHRVIATARDSSKLTALQAAGAATLDLDVTSDEASLAATFAKANSVYEGGITHVVNCAGYLLEGSVEEASQKEVYDVFNTNVFGTFNVARAAAPYLREAAKVEGQTPALATFGSLASWWSGAAVAHYCSTKFAVTGLTEGLAEELRPFGIAVCCIEPGYTRTEFLTTGGGDRRAKTARQLDVYEGTEAAKMRAAMDVYSGNQLGDVRKGARVIVDVLTREGVAKGREVPVRLVLGSDCLETVRAKCESTLKLVKEWEDVSASTDHDSGAK